jgi:uncharacterized protein YggE
MKPLFFLSLGLFIAAMPNASIAQSQNLLNRNLVFAEGSADVTGENDSARILLSVQSEAREMEKAAADNATKTKAVLQAVKALPIKDLKIKTRNYRITPQKDYKAKPPVTKGYEVRNEIEITTEGFAPKELSAQVSKMIATSLKNGANSVHNIQFYIRDKQELEKQGLSLATKEAMAQAQILASAAGVKLGRIVSISNQPIAVPIRAEMFRSAGAAVQETSMEPPIESGESKIFFRVSVVYEIMD